MHTFLSMLLFSYPWVVQIWKPASSRIVGHGALLSADKVLSSCNAFATVSNLAEDKHEMIVHDYGGVGRQIPFCSDSRFADSIMIHPKCDPSDALQFHDFAMWNLERAFEVIGQPFLMSLLLENEYLRMKIGEIGLNDRCRMVATDDPAERDSFGKEKIVERCGFKSGSLDICDGENCTQQPADGLLCFNSRTEFAGSWKVRKPSESPDFLEGSVVLCFGTPVGMASRTFYRNEYQVYRMFSNFIDNMDFLKVSWTPPTTSPVTKTSRKPDTDGARRQEKRMTPINCSCPLFNESIYTFGDQTSVHGDQLWSIMIATLGIHTVFNSFVRA